MSYLVSITSGRRLMRIDGLDEDLKKGCAEAVKYKNSIYVFGRHGSGRTSVLKYFNYMAPEFWGVEESEVLFMRAFDFIDDLIKGIRNSELTDFRNKFHNAKVIIIDDIDRFAHKDTTQSEFRDILEMNKIIVISGIYSADQLPLLEDIKIKVSSFTNMEIDECYDGDACCLDE